jgi:hypothetical protein
VRISETLSRKQLAAPERDLNISIRVGESVPPRVHLNRLPPEIVSIEPEYRDYDYFTTDDDIVIVEPDSHRIVSEVPRDPSRATEWRRETGRRQQHGGRQRWQSELQDHATRFNRQCDRNPAVDGWLQHAAGIAKHNRSAARRWLVRADRARRIRGRYSGGHAGAERLHGHPRTTAAVNALDYYGTAHVRDHVLRGLGPPGRSRLVDRQLVCSRKPPLRYVISLMPAAVGNNFQERWFYLGLSRKEVCKCSDIS